MRVKWFGQSAFSLQAGEITVAIDPFDDLSGLKDRGIAFDYPPIEVSAQLPLITHEHVDHNGVNAVSGDPVILRSTAGRRSRLSVHRTGPWFETAELPEDVRPVAVVPEAP